MSNKPRREEAAFTLNMPGGPKNYSIFTLIRRDAMEVMHNTIRPLLMGLSGAVGPDGSLKESGGIGAISSLVEKLDFDSIFEIGEKLLDQAMVDNVEIDFEDYYGQNPMELYPAIYHCLKANYPDVFSILQGAIDQASKTLETAMNLKPSENQPSTDSEKDSKTTKFKISKSQNSTRSARKK